MPKTDLYNMEGNVVGEVELKDSIFGVEVNEDALYIAVEAYLANQRQGTQSTKTRSEVRGGGAKPWRQKGTGRARQGSIRATQWIKGGIALGPKPRSFKMTINKKVKRLAIKSALTSKVNENNIIVLDNLEFNEIKTKNMVNVLNNLKVDTKALVVLAEKNENVMRSTRNIQGVKASLTNTINVFDLLKHDKLIVTKEAIEKIEEVYA